MGKSCTVLSVYISTRHLRICPKGEYHASRVCVEIKKQFVKYLRQILQILTRAKVPLTPTGDLPI